MPDYPRCCASCNAGDCDRCKPEKCQCPHPRHGPGPHTAVCDVTGCGWISGSQPNATVAGCMATWHVYEEHRDVWVTLAGDRLPADPDPRIPAVYQSLAAG